MQWSRERRYIAGGVRCPRDWGAEQLEAVPESRSAAGMGQQSQQPLSLQALHKDPSAAQWGCPTGTFSLTASLAGRHGATFRAALSQ